MILSAILGLLVSVVLFLVLRAGIINQTQIDTFNVWGVTGVAAHRVFLGNVSLRDFQAFIMKLLVLLK